MSNKKMRALCKIFFEVYDSGMGKNKSIRFLLIKKWSFLTGTGAEC